MQVFFVASECAPIIKVGGLADVVGSLPKALIQQGIKPVIIIPGNSQAKVEKYLSINVLRGINYNNTEEEVVVKQIYLPGTNPSTALRASIPVYLIENDHYLSYSNIYEAGEGYTLIDRFAFFSISALKLIEQLTTNYHLPTTIIHCHDWHAALIPFLVKQKQLPYKTILTIHNLGGIYQGITDEDLLRKININSNSGNQVFNILEHGIEDADIVTTVSPTYAKEIMTPECGEGLENTLKIHGQKLYGVLNGIDIDYWNPETDGYISSKFPPSLFELRRTSKVSAFVESDSTSADRQVPSDDVQIFKYENKKALLEKVNFKVSDEELQKIPLFGFVGRVMDQKGFNILIPALNNLFSSRDIRVIILATGDKNLEQKVRELEHQYSQKLRFINEYNESLSHQIYAGSDFFLVPSKYEPCGLTQMIAMRYGAVPIVRKTGGLADTVIDCQTGFVFSEYSSEALLKKIEFAISSLIRQPADQNPLISQMIHNVIRQDFSWSKSAGEYVKLYDSLFE